MILERDQELATLAQVHDDLDSSGGRVVLVRGEAGIGKSSLVAEFVASIGDRSHVLVGACDDLLTPQPFGPVWDVARSEPAVATPLARNDRRGVMEALFELLSRELRPTVLVFEDMQWADEATLDAVRFLGRRAARTNGIICLTYRDGEVDTDHPLRGVIGDLPPQNIARIQLDHLSPEAVAELIANTGFDLDEVLTLTGGNPLFVTEVAGSGVDAVPASVRDSVLARAAKLSPGARRTLELVSIMPGESEQWLIDALGHPSADELREGVRQELLRIGEDTVAFCHELQRRAIVSSLSASDRRALNQRALHELTGRADPSRLVHHAREAGDGDAIVEFAPEAARAAMAIESYAEALAHFHALEPHLSRVAAPERAAVLDDWAHAEFYRDNAEALDVVTRAIDLHRAVGDDQALGRALAFAVRVNEVNGRPEPAAACSVEAVDLLEGLPASADLAFAISQQAWLRLMQGDDDLQGIELADRAISVAREVGDDLTVARSLVLKGAIGHSSATGRTSYSLVEEGHELAVRGGFRFEEVYALINMAGLMADVREVERAADLAQRARDAAIRYEIRSLESYSQAMYAEILVWKGDWASAEDLATEVLGSHAHAELVAWRMLGTLQARRGRSEAGATLERMWSIAEASAELQNLDPAASALAEHLWLSGSNDPVRLAALREVLDRGLRSGYVWPSGALAFWMWKLGALPAVPDTLSDFYRWIIDGEWETAAAFWHSRGVPYERALALMHGDDDARLEALRVFEDLGAVAADRRLRRELLDAGVNIPRGKARATRDHAAGLTARQAEVLELLAEGLTNAEIADRLFVSRRTVDNHVSAVLMKLDVASRSRAVDVAREQGLLPAG